VPSQLQQDIKYANNVFYGKNGAHWKMEKHRICWYVLFFLASIPTTAKRKEKKRSPLFRG
jgi:hypothetical protein